MGILDSFEDEKDENCVMSASEMRIMANIAAKATILVLAILKPRYNLLCFLMANRLLKGSETGKRPVTSGYFKMFGKILTNRIKILAVV